MKWIVTGAAGFIGCHAVNRLLREGHEVIALDNLSRAGSALNLEWLRQQGLQTFIQADIRNMPELRKLFGQHADADVVLHLAGQVAVTTSLVDPRADFEANALGTFNVLEAVRNEAAGRPTVLYSSTNKVYGDLHHLNTTEGKGRYALADRPRGVDEAEPLDFHSPYGCSKGAGDQYVRDYARVYGMRTVVFRQSCIYGTRQFGVEDQGWIAWFSIAALTGKPITIYGNGKQVRDALWVEDLVNLYLLAAQRIEAVQGQVFNIGGGPNNTLSILELVDRLERVHGRSLEMSFAEPRTGDQRVFIADVRKAERSPGWKPTVSVEEGLNKLLAWLQANRELFVNANGSVPTRQAVPSGIGKG
jgi:CDP-paratose 2-epimerase